jgi:hypothetical protein
MTQADDLDALNVEIARCVTAIAGARARERRYQIKLESACGDSSIDRVNRGVAHHHIARAVEQRQKIEQRLSKLRQQQAAEEGHDDMRRADIEDVVPATLAPPSIEHILVVRKSGGLKIGEQQFSYGQQIDVAVLANTLNCNHLFRHGHVRWELRFTYKPVEAKPVAPAVIMKPTDHMVILAYAMQKLIDAGRVSNLVDAEDVVSHDLFVAAEKQFTNEPGIARDGAFGSGGRHVPTGQGTHRRIFDVDRFRQRIRDILKERQAA